MIDDIETLVRCESPSHDHEAVARSAEAVAGIGRRLLGAEPERIVTDGCTHLRWRFGDGEPRVLLLGHHDTVWPLGSLRTHPFEVRDGILRGPGCFDMKAGVVMALHAAAALPDRDGLSILITGDEEIGSPRSRTLIEEEAKSCDAVFVLEASADGGAAALRERLFTPLALKRTSTLPEEALLQRAAMGHVAAGDADPEPAPVWGPQRSAGPAGLITASTEDVLAFARLHLTGGLGPDGSRVLSAESARAMTEEQFEMPDKDTLGDSWGLGWIRFGWDGHRVYGHDGNTIGQAAFLRILPGHGLAVTLLTNGGSTHDLYEELYREIFAELAGVAMPRPLEPAVPAPDVDASEFLGVYERESVRIDVLDRDGKLWMRQTVTGPLAELMPETTTEDELVPVGPAHFAFSPAGMRGWVSVTFYELPTGERYLHSGVRATPKVKE